MRADIHDGQEDALQSEAGYIDARPLTAKLDKVLLQRTAGPYIGSGTTDAWCLPDVRFAPVSSTGRRNTTSRELAGVALEQFLH